MKKITFWIAFMLSMALGNISRAQDCATTVIYENFDSASTPDLPHCWSALLRGETLSGVSSVQTSEYNSYSMPNCISMTKSVDGSTANDDDDVMLVSPPLSTLSGGTYRLKLKATTSSDDISLQIGTLNTNDATAAFNYIGEFDITSEYAEYVLNFDSYTGTDTYIGIRLSAESFYANVNIDNIIWEPIPACSDVTDISIASVSFDSAVAQWAAGGSESAWQIVHGDINAGDPNALTPSDASENSTEISGLEANTQYKIWIRSVCEEGNGAWIGPEVFRTACTPVASFFQDFNVSDTPDMPECWSSIVTGEGLSFGYIETRTYGGVSEPSSLYMYRSLFDDYSDADANVILVSPMVSSLQGGTNRLKLYAKGDADDVVLQVGTVSATNADAEFTLVEEVPLTQAYTQYTVSFDTYTGEDTFVAFRLSSESSSTGATIDAVTWEAIPACADVTGITFPTVTPATANIEWTAGDAETAWDVVYSSESSNPGELTPIAVTGGNPATEISSLTPDTEYKVWVRSVCGAGIGAWIGPETFRTPCLPITAFYEDFDSTNTPDLPSCWSAILRGDTLEDTSYITTLEYNSYSEPHNVVLNKVSADGSGNGDDVILVSPTLSTAGSGSYRLKLYAVINDGNASLQVGTLNGNNEFATFTSIDDIEISHDYAQYTVNFDSESEDTFIGIRINASGTASVNVDNILWEPIPTCPDVTDIAISSVTNETATAQWSVGGTESEWQVVYGGTDVTDPATLTPANVTENHAALSGLESNTEYQVWVRSVCAGNDFGAWIGPKTFLTSCAPVAAFFENMDTTETYTLPACWSSIIRGEGIKYAYVQTSEYNGNYSTPNALYLYREFENASFDDEQADVMLVSPYLSNLGAATNRLRFRASSGDSNVTFQIGTLSGADAGADFNVIGEIDVEQNEFPEYTVDFNNYTGTDAFIGIRIKSNTVITGAVLDDITWEAIPNCPDVNNVQVPETTTATATITWEGGSADAWQVAYGDNAATDPSTLELHEVAATNYTIEGLSADTDYKVWVRSTCEEGFGAWRGPVAFSTLCTATNVPYVLDFEAVDTPDLPGCTVNLNVGQGNDWTTSEPNDDGFFSKALTYRFNFDHPADVWFFTQGINMLAGTEYVISYKYGNNTPSQTESFDVMYGASASVEGMTELIAEHPEVTGETPETNTVTFSPETSGVYYFGFHATSIANQYNLYIDDIAIDANLSNGDFDTAGFAYYPNPVKDILNLSYVHNITDVKVYNVIGQEIIAKTVNAGEARLDMSSIAKGTYIVKVTAGNLVKTIKVIKQ